ncbi:MAG TPA: hypothetical protein VFM54_16275, partial [Micromonosporaceae bacterium]|nr:hypothetical protein [Micromonosporaceae bacterium]
GWHHFPGHKPLLAEPLTRQDFDACRCCWPGQNQRTGSGRYRKVDRVAQLTDYRQSQYGRTRKYHIVPDSIMPQHDFFAPPATASGRKNAAIR